MSSKRKSNLSLNCSKCKSEYVVYEAARTMPCCNKPLCYLCIHSVTDSIKNGRFTCIICEQEAEMSMSGFPLDTEIAKMLEQSLVITGSLKESAKLVDLKETIRNLEFESLNGHQVIVDFFIDQKRTVQLDA